MSQGKTDIVARVYVLTAERYCDITTVLGAFLELDKAVAVFKNAETLSPLEQPEGWTLQAFENDKPLKWLHRFSRDNSIGFHDKIVRTIFPNKHDHTFTYEEVDPFQFDWVNYEPIEREPQ